MNEVVTLARRWIGTPYVHQAACMGAGCDCLGLIRGIWNELVGHEPEHVSAYSMDWSEPQGDERLWRAARRWLIPSPLQEELAGQVLLFRMRDRAVAKHLGIAAEMGANASFIHAYSGHTVTESPLSTAWRRRIVARFKFPLEVK
ncbi:peptidase [Shimia thalassica]|uniref:peptidase n=1 Tax=Shimia thalassica TaxID=1715693 RepID=UPI002495834E|nr:peptidase [Shimia thalassica]